jgi:predicted lipid carrier protein YhbT
MPTARDKVLEIEAKLAEESATFAEINGVCQLVLVGDGGGSWLMKSRGTPSISEGTGDADCTLRMSARDYLELAEGRSDTRQLFFSGRLEVEGDLSLAIKLGSWLEPVR